MVLIGESNEHGTVVVPLGLGKRVDRSYIPTMIFRRFAHFSEGVEVRVDVSMTKGGGKGETGKSRQLKPLSAVLDRLPLASVFMIQIDKSQFTKFMTRSTQIWAIHKGERYDFKTQSSIPVHL